MRGSDVTQSITFIYVGRGNIVLLFKDSPEESLRKNIMISTCLLKNDDATLSHYDKLYKKII
jgi:hypothetical protein